jgi:cell wall-associated NlpC family hydrolase
MTDSLEQQCAQKRNDILAYAKRLADDGAHYLWGAQGEKPSATGTVQYAPVVLDSGKTDQTTFCAATITVSNVVYVCAGRFRHSDLATAKPSKKIAMPRTGTPDPSAVKELTAFIDKNSKTPSAQIGWGTDLTPRMVKGDKIMDYSTNTDVTDLVVWGEGCDDTQHFDCGGFVRYVVRKVCGVPIDGISMNPDKKNVHGEPLGSLVAEGDDILPADILVYAGHIAFALGTPAQKYSSVTDYALAQAESAVYGVNYGKKHSQHSQKCIRLSPSTLLNKKTVTA